MFTISGMKILTVCSGIDFVNFTRRATIEAIHMINPEMDILQYNSILNIFKRKERVTRIRFYNYHFWTVESLRKFRIFQIFEYSLRYIYWKNFFKRYQVIFFIDPNQYYLLPYLSRYHKLVYLLRDPSILQDPDNFHRELPIIKRADIILGISQNLCSYYFKKYYGYIPSGVHLWPNTVDLDLWNYKRWTRHVKPKERALVGFAGNINYVIDIGLLIYIAERLPEIDFELAGKISLNMKEKEELDHLLKLPNVRHLGFITYDHFPAVVMNWDIGLVTAKPDHEYALYLNNNKQYQYMALGKPFVTYRLNADYREFLDLVFIAENKIDYVEKIKLALEKAKEISCPEKGLKIARNHSSEIRAKQFLQIVSHE